MRRRVFNLLAVVSLVLCLATAALWIRSEFRGDEVQYSSFGSAGTSQSIDGVGYARGLFVYAHAFYQARRKPVPRMWGPGWHVFSAVPGGFHAREIRAHGFYFLGFGYAALSWTFNAGTGPVTLTRKDRLLCVPVWFVMLLLALAPVRWLVLKRREIRNRPRHLCANCGYDLRATPDAGGPLLERCPECGTPCQSTTAHAQCGPP